MPKQPEIKPDLPAGDLPESKENEWRNPADEGSGDQPVAEKPAEEGSGDRTVAEKPAEEEPGDRSVTGKTAEGDDRGEVMAGKPGEEAGADRTDVDIMTEHMADILMGYKLAVLHVLSLLKRPVTVSQLCDVLLEMLFTHYFHLRQALAELEETGFITREMQGNVSAYELTAEGREAYFYLEKELASDIRHQILVRIRELRLDTRQAISAQADYKTTVAGGTLVHCTLREGMTEIIDLQLSVPGTDAAKEAVRLWPLKARRVYEKIMEELL